MLCPQKYYKDTEINSHVHEIYTTTIGYDTGTVFPIEVNGRTFRALLDTGAESCMNLDMYEKLKLTTMNTSFVPTLKGATGHDMLTKRNHLSSWTETLPYQMPSQSDGPGMVPKSYAQMTSLFWNLRRTLKERHWHFPDPSTFHLDAQQLQR